MLDFSNLEHLFEAGEYAQWMQKVKESIKEHQENVINQEISRLYTSSDWHAGKTRREEWEEEKVDILIEHLDRIFQAGAHTAWIQEATLCMKESNERVDKKIKESKEKGEEAERKRKLRQQELRKDNIINRLFKKEVVERAREAAAKYQKEIESLDSSGRACLALAEEYIKLSKKLREYIQS